MGSSLQRGLMTLKRRPQMGPRRQHLRWRWAPKSGGNIRSWPVQALAPTMVLLARWEGRCPGRALLFVRGRELLLPAPPALSHSPRRANLWYRYLHAQVD